MGIVSTNARDLRDLFLVIILVRWLYIVVLKGVPNTLLASFADILIDNLVNSLVGVEGPLFSSG